MPRWSAYGPPDERPTNIDAHGRSETVVTARTGFTVGVDLANDQSPDALTAYLRDGHPAEPLATTLRGALDPRRQIADLTAQRDQQVTSMEFMSWGLNTRRRDARRRCMSCRPGSDGRCAG